MLGVFEMLAHTRGSGFPGSVLFLRRTTVCQLLGLGSRIFVAQARIIFKEASNGKRYR
jgi:hypothetical protein